MSQSIANPIELEPVVLNATSTRFPLKPISIKVCTNCSFKAGGGRPPPRPGREEAPASAEERLSELSNVMWKDLSADCTAFEGYLRTTARCEGQQHPATGRCEENPERPGIKLFERLRLRGRRAASHPLFVQARACAELRRFTAVGSGCCTSRTGVAWKESLRETYG